MFAAFFCTYQAIVVQTRVFVRVMSFATLQNAFPLIFLILFAIGSMNIFLLIFNVILQRAAQILLFFLIFNAFFLQLAAKILLLLILHFHPGSKRSLTLALYVHLSTFARASASKLFLHLSPRPQILFLQFQWLLE